MNSNTTTNTATLEKPVTVISENSPAETIEVHEGPAETAPKSLDASSYHLGVQYGRK